MHEFMSAFIEFNEQRWKKREKGNQNAASHIHTRIKVSLSEYFNIHSES